MKFIEGLFNRLIFGISFLLVPLYLGLVAALVVYNVNFWHEILGVLAYKGPSEALFLIVLGLIDATIAAQLIVMTSVGGYIIYVNPGAFDGMKNKPRWLNDFDTTQQKIKMSMSMMSVSGIDILRLFVEAGDVSWDMILKKAFLHVLFMVTTFSLVFMRKVSHTHQH